MKNTLKSKNSKVVKNEKYAFKPDVIIDLHGLVLVEAKKVLQETFCDYDNKSRDSKKVRLITGKGNHSEWGISKIREEVKHFLKKHDLPWKYAKIHEGGEGVIDVG